MDAEIAKQKSVFDQQQRNQNKKKEKDDGNDGDQSQSGATTDEDEIVKAPQNLRKRCSADFTDIRQLKIINTAKKNWNIEKKKRKKAVSRYHQEIKHLLDIVNDSAVDRFSRYVFPSLFTFYNVWFYSRS